MYYRIKSPETVSEVFDDEVVALSLATGNYYSLTGAAQVIWPWLQLGVTADDVAVGLAATFGGGVDAYRTDAETFLESLVAERLVVTDVSPSPDGLAAVTGGAHVDYVPPAFQCFGDMQELLLLDPVHEVDEAGWPAPAETGSGTGNG